MPNNFISRLQILSLVMGVMGLTGLLCGPPAVQRTALMLSPFSFCLTLFLWWLSRREDDGNGL